MLTSSRSRIHSILLALAALAWSKAPAVPLRKAEAEPVLRLEGPIAYPKLQGANRYLSFTDLDGHNLRILDLANHDIIDVTSDRVGPAYFWSPDGVRLLYRALFAKDGRIASELRAFDSKLNRSVALDQVAGLSGYPTFDPRELKIFLMHEKGILLKQLDFPGERPAAWQKIKKPYDGQWVATQRGMLWLTDRGLSMKKLLDDGSGVQSFSISPDGQRVAWATQKGMIYTAVAPGAEATLLEAGRDPQWHPVKPLLAYAAARQIGGKVYDFDIKISDLKSPGRYVRATADLAERWPLWLDGETLLFTADQTTDLFRLRFALPAPIAVKVQESGRVQ